jgi:hypothetical protein
MSRFFGHSTAVLAAVVPLVLATPAIAQFGGLGGIIPGTSGQSSPNAISPEDLDNNLSVLDVRFAHAMQEMLTAQSFTLAALGDKARADQLSSEAKSLEGVNDIDTVSRSVSVSEDASKEIDAKMNSSQTLDAQSKSTLAMAVPHYGVGMVQAAHLPHDYQDWVTHAKQTVTGMGNNPMSAFGRGAKLAGKLPDIVQVTASLPDLISTWSGTTNNFIKYAHGNQIDTGDLSNKI